MPTRAPLLKLIGALVPYRHAASGGLAETAGGLDGAMSALVHSGHRRMRGGAIRPPLITHSDIMECLPNLFWTLLKQIFKGGGKVSL